MKNERGKKRGNRKQETEKRKEERGKMKNERGRGRGRKRREGGGSEYLMPRGTNFRDLEALRPLN
jgi:hypothetical protein